MTDFTPQSTDRLPGDTSPDTIRVLFRGHKRINTSTWDVSGGIYSKSVEIDLGQFKFTTPTDVRVTALGTQLFTAPFFYSNAAGTVLESCYYFLSSGSKFSATSLKLTIIYKTYFDTQVELYFQILSNPVNNTLFIDV